MAKKHGRKHSHTPEQWTRLKKSRDPVVGRAKRRDECLREQAAQRNPQYCVCQVDPQWDPAQMMPDEIRRTFGVLSTRDVPVHMSSCPHSELASTTQGRKPPTIKVRPRGRG